MNQAVELTQAALALLVVLGTLGLLLLGNRPVPSEWWTVTALVVGYYFGQSRQGARPTSSAVLMALTVATVVLVAHFAIPA